MIPNPERLIMALDDKLDHSIRLVLYGRSAIWLGFDNTPAETAATKDIDGIIELAHLDELVHDEQFWDARDAVNAELNGEGLYITHLFQENQVFLRKTWREHLISINRLPVRHLRLFRPATIDLLLTKMMRGNDEADFDDIRFFIQHDHLTRLEIERAFADMQPIELVELQDAFDRAKPFVLAMLTA
jgi:hypothetical protein